jgi:CRISPR/Cas system-associated exonuclease Cas4 (RecB family)
MLSARAEGQLGRRVTRMVDCLYCGDKLPIPKAFYCNRRCKLMHKGAEIERQRILEEVKKSESIVSENDLQEMEHIELSYTGELIPVEEVERIIKEADKYGK